MKKKNRKIILFTFLTALLVVLSACGNNNDETKTENGKTENIEQKNKQEQMDMEEGMDGMDHSNMDMSSSGEVPEGLKVAENPTYKVGNKAIIEADHMEGMKGAEATIVGAYDTTAYAVSYTSKTNGERVENHKWVIHEELVDAGDAPLAPGTEVKTVASHMEGMEGMTVEIDSAEETTVYMVDFTTTTGGGVVKNHKWVTESELAPAE